ncbi:MAG: formylglycine-generating enzyme family protein [Pelodictyon phaeoclathratiforme]|nr:formylglycine-generating enzyme family protein [Pelodictyon phaeoclathratiforme]
MGLAFLSWFLSLILSLLALLSGKGKRNTAAKSSAAGTKPVNVEALYLASARSKRRRLLAASLFCFTGICFGGLTVFSAAFPGLSSMQSPANFVLIRGSEFTMGSPETEVGHESDETQHQVKVNDFYMSKYEVTVAEFRRFIAESGYRTDAEKAGDSYVWNGSEAVLTKGVNWRHGVSGKVRTKSEENHPVVHVSWNDAVEYCRWLSEKTGKWYRLPTEAEWEYACRAGSRTAFNTGGNITTAQANYDGNYPYNKNRKGQYRARTVAVESFEPNAWGLYNMHGNVWEWCDDVYSGTYYDECKAKGLVENPGGPAPETGSNRVLRGGSWNYDAEYCRSASRRGYTPGGRSNFVGFRPVFVP